MRDAADNVDAHVERPVEAADAVLGAVVAILREGDELEVDIGFDPLLHFQERFDRHQLRV